MPISHFISLISIIVLTGCNHHNNPSIKSTNSKTKFNEIDTNHNKKISFDELADFKKKREDKFINKSLNSNFEACDKDKNSIITKDEIRNSNINIPPIYGEINNKNPNYICFLNKNDFLFFDKNQDNKITKEELKQIKKNTSYSEKCDKNSDNKLDIKEATSSSCGYPLDEFKARDFNHDGFITLEEEKYLSAKKSFQYLDKNKDNTLDENEFKEMSFFADSLN